jgi:hypothetical protein
MGVSFSTGGFCACALAVLQNGKLLKVYGRFQEWVLHDPHKAARSYAEAIKRGLGDNMLNLTSESDWAVQAAFNQPATAGFAGLHRQTAQHVQHA